MSTFLGAVRRGEHRFAATTWAAGIAAAVYTIAPIDVIPEVLLGPLGLTDDLGVWGVFAVLYAREHARWRANRLTSI